MGHRESVDHRNGFETIGPHCRAGESDAGNPVVHLNTPGLSPDPSSIAYHDTHTRSNPSPSENSSLR